MRQLMAFVMILLAVFYLGNAPGIAGTVSQAQLQQINQLWQGSAHAFAQVNCSTCHQQTQTQALIIQPTVESCRSCHQRQVETFLFGKHGIRLGEGMTPLTPKMADLPMKASALETQMTCSTCHDAHSVNTLQASVDSCLRCHNDRHSLNYTQSKHAQLFTAQPRLPQPTAESVTCATCHLPRQEIGSTVFVNHNNTFTLLPRDRMVKEVCMNCHGLEYSYNSIFDDKLVEANFAQPPTQTLKTLEMIRALKQKR